MTGALPSPKSTAYVAMGLPHEVVASSVRTEVTNGATPLDGDGMSSPGTVRVSCRSMAPRSGRPVVPVPVSATSGSSTTGAPSMSVVSSPGASASPESMSAECSGGAVRAGTLSPSMSCAPWPVASCSDTEVVYGVSAHAYSGRGRAAVPEPFAAAL
ncbi:hypothetical protein [Streptomyces sp. LamerLS-31b]|uniref:hypothetical protein n=1 Tax=Streptomyces sp. LamerLS-31b TaxID=1839765 RepID=UPI001EFC2247|nr:hypothetical protein [Streptomyces sp. LamerLS-31b]